MGWACMSAIALDQEYRHAFAPLPEPARKNRAGFFYIVGGDKMSSCARERLQREGGSVTVLRLARQGAAGTGRTSGFGLRVRGS
jgi:hypothetical protein